MKPEIDPALAILTVVEVAQVLRCHPDKVYGLVRTGAIRGTRLGKASIRITREELERFIRYGSATTGENPEYLDHPLVRT